jgi:hypothetical protein
MLTRSNDSIYRDDILLSALVFVNFHSSKWQTSANASMCVANNNIIAAVVKSNSRATASFFVYSGVYSGTTASARV